MSYTGYSRMDSERYVRVILVIYGWTVNAMCESYTGYPQMDSERYVCEEYWFSGYPWMNCERYV